jgi:hypothetical protein
VLLPAAVVDGWQAEGLAVAWGARDKAAAVAVAKAWGKLRGKGRGPAVANAAVEAAARDAGEAPEARR